MSLEDYLLTEALNPLSTAIDRLSALEIVSLMNAEDSKAVAAVRVESARIAQAIECVAERFRGGGRLIYVGAGTSGRLGVLDASECPPTFGVSPEMVVGIIAGGKPALTKAVEGAEDDREQGAADLRAVNPTALDFVMGIATSGRTPYVLGAIDEARRVGAYTAGIACNRPSLLGEAVDLDIAPLVGPEILAGSTRLKAGTATKLILNMITTGAMIRLGKSYGNRMIDLQPTNVKLKLRSCRILREIAGIDEKQATDLLTRLNWKLKPAVVASLAGVEPEEAIVLLARSGGQVRDAVISARREQSS